VSAEHLTWPDVVAVALTLSTLIAALWFTFDRNQGSR
jgi:hypothetical protein